MFVENRSEQILSILYIRLRNQENKFDQKRFKDTFNRDEIDYVEEQ